MKCLSVLQPWASLLVGGEKTIETRSWGTGHRGTLLIHASKAFKPAARDLCLLEPFRSALNPILANVPENLPCGMILGVVHLYNCLPVQHLPFIDEKETAFGDFSQGRFGWMVSAPKRFLTPIPFTGQLGLYDVPDNLLEGVQYA